MITYSKLYEDIADTLNKTNLDDVIPGRVRLAELAIYRRLNIDLNLKTVVLTGADDPINPIALPGDYKLMQLLTANDIPLERLSDQRYQAELVNYGTRYEDTNLPWAFAEVGNDLFILPWPSEIPDDWGSTQIKIVYYGYDSSELFNMGYDAFLYGGLWHMAQYMNAPQPVIDRHEGTFTKALSSLDYNWTRKQYSGSTKQVTSTYG